MIRKPRLFGSLLIANAVASTAHFADNALRFDRYPEPAWITGPAVVDVLWFAITPLLPFAWWLAKRGRRGTALTALALYAVLSLFTLGHYFYASPMELSLGMNALIAVEATAATLLLMFGPLAIGRRSAPNA